MNLAEEELQLRGARALLVRAERHTYHRYGPNRACRILRECREAIDLTLRAQQDGPQTLISGTKGHTQ